MEYLLSIVIPTRNRQYYALESVKQILSVTDDRVQIIVSDNSDDNSLEAVIAELQSSRIKYQFISTRIPGVDNYGNGIAMSDGRYVCCIGDDDGVLRYAVDVAEWADKNGIKAIKPGTQCTYLWPNAVEIYKTGNLSVDAVNLNYWYEDVGKNLRTFLRSGCLDLMGALLPKAYHGIVRRDMFEKIKEKTGRYCGGLSPDIYLSVSLSLLVDKVLCMNAPLTIFGVCKASTSADTLNKLSYGRLEDAPHFVGQAYEWSSKVPRYYCRYNIWADSALHAINDMRAYDLMEEFSVESLTAQCKIEYGGFKKEIKENFELNHGDKKLLGKLLRKRYPKYFVSVFKAKMRRNKFIFGMYRKMREEYQKRSQSETFTLLDVITITQAEAMVSEALRGKFAELIAKLEGN